MIKGFYIPGRLRYVKEQSFGPFLGVLDHPTLGG